MKKQSSAGENLQLKVSAQTVTSRSRPHPTPRPMGGEARRLREDLAVGGGAAGVGGRECGEKLGCRTGNEAPLTGRPLGTMCGPLLWAPGREAFFLVPAVRSRISFLSLFSGFFLPWVCEKGASWQRALLLEGATHLHPSSPPSGPSALPPPPSSPYLAAT